MATTEEVIDMLKVVYCMEFETVMNYVANSTNLDGVRAEEIKKSLATDVAVELVPGSASVTVGVQRQPPDDTTDVVNVIEAVIEAEQAACDQYKKIIRATEGDDYVTQDLCIRLLADEEEHLVLFKGFLKEYSPN
ncbi:MAG: rubrerythrin [Planctomycetaceae bacterium]|nr:rubrerythrin [Planctomycetaceae bacterium]MBP61564.1 rubrerythrin [Planctomycetaceae bacterium]